MSTRSKKYIRVLGFIPLVCAYAVVGYSSHSNPALLALFALMAPICAFLYFDYTEKFVRAKRSRHHR